jgi:hypothetical protein
MPAYPEMRQHRAAMMGPSIGIAGGKVGLR